MAFPQTILPLKVELRLGSTWTDITSDVYARDQIRLSRGRSDEGQRVDAGRCSMTLDNRTGKYSPRNPTGAYYGQIGRNTPVRVSVHTGTPYLEVLGGASDRATTPDHASLDITGDLDVRVEVRLEDWQAQDEAIELAGKWATGQKSWLLFIYQQRLWLYTSADGTAEVQNFSSDTYTVLASGRMAVRATIDVNNGAGGKTVTFYTSDSITGMWTQLGSPVTSAGTTSIFNSTSAVDIGAVGAVGFGDPSGAIYKAEIRNGIAGTVVANPDFTAQTVGATSFADGAGRTWTMSGNAAITNRKTRFVGEVSSWPSRWDVSGSDVYVPIEAAGILRRYGQGASPLESTLRRRVPTEDTILAYWPLEEGESATRAYSPLEGVLPLVVSGFQWAQDDTLPGSTALPTLAATASMSGTVPGSSTGEFFIGMVYYLETMPSTLTTLMDVSATGTGAHYIVQVATNNVRVQVLDSAGTQILLINSTSPEFTGTWNRLQLNAVPNGGNIDVAITWVTIGGGGLAATGSFAGTAGRVTRIASPFGSGLAGLRMGHLAIFEEYQTFIYNDADVAFAGDTAGDRLARLGSEEDLPIAVYGPAEVQVGAQRTMTLLDLLREAEDADHGILYELRDQLALGYRDRISMHNQTARLELDYTADGEVAPPLEPVDDDQHVRNDITITRVGGSSARATLSTGTLSTQAPPNGVGRYTESQTLNLYDDTQLDDHAGWLLHLGTWDETRYPVLRVNLAGGTHLIEDVAAVDIGDRVTIANPPAWLPPDTIDLIVQGYTETLSQYEWLLEFTCTPAGPWNVAYADNTTYARADTAGSSLSSSATSSATSISVATASGPLWTTSGAEAPFDIRVGGEVMTVTAVSGASSPQTFTVTRSVNGVVKAQSSGTDVRLAHPPIIAL